jgi:hypothetical protein
MKRSGIVVVTSIGLSVLSVLAVGCGSSGVSTTPGQTPSTAPASSTPSTPSAQKAGVGDTINLSDAANGKKIAVTVVKVVDPDSPSNEFATPPAGDRFESIQFRIVNTGTGTFQDDPLAEITAKDAAGQSMKLELGTSTAAGAQMPSAVSLAPGDTALGFVTFDIASGDSIAQAQYSLNGGSGTTGEWQIGNGQPLPSSSPSSTGTAAPPPAPTATASPPATASANSPEAVVQQYFAAITARDYALAWALGGKNIEGGSYNQFVQGFATTSSDSVTIVSTSGDTVTITLDATQTDGTHKFFAGTYTVQNGVIIAANVH